MKKTAAVIAAGLLLAACTATQNTAENSPAAQSAGAIVQDEAGAEAGIVINTSGSLNLLVIKHSAAHSPLRDAAGNAFSVQHLFFAAENSSEDKE